MPDTVAVDAVEALLAGATSREPFLTSDSKSGARFERVVIDGQPHIVKHLHVDDDWIMRMAGDVVGYPWRVWTSGLLDRFPDCIDTAIVGAASGEGRNGWGAALLLRDVGAHLVPEGSEPVSLEQHRRFLDHMAALGATFWDWTDDRDLLPYQHRWLWFGQEMIELEAARPEPEPVPIIAARGWEAFAAKAPADVSAGIDALRASTEPLVAALQATPSTFLHGDWKMGNLGSHPDGRTILLDFAAPGQGPIAHDLGWYLAINRDRIPEPIDDAIDAFEASLRGHGVATEGWWSVQRDLCLLGTLVQFGWEKALGEGEAGARELGWWCDRAREGLARL